MSTTRTSWDRLGPPRTGKDLLGTGRESLGFSSPREVLGRCWIKFRPILTHWDRLGPAGTAWDAVQTLEAFWDRA